jgi:ACR3 family arsenite transporter
MTDTPLPAAAGLGRFERWLSVWVALAIGSGLVLGNLVPGAFAALAALEVALVNLPVAALIWAMVFPMMVGVDFGALRRIGDRPKGLIVTLVVNWLVKPFTMAALGVLFFEIVFAGLIPPDDAQTYLAGVILLGAAPCTAMVFAFAPIIAFLLGVIAIVVPWETLLISVGLCVVLPLLAGIVTRRRIEPHRHGRSRALRGAVPPGHGQHRRDHWVISQPELEPRSEKACRSSSMSSYPAIRRSAGAMR